MESDEYGILIETINKNYREQIRISINEYLGNRYLDIRVFYKNVEEYFPSKKGVTLQVEKYHELLDGIVQLGEALGYGLQSEDGENNLSSPPPP